MQKTKQLKKQLLCFFKKELDFFYQM